MIPDQLVLRRLALAACIFAAACASDRNGAGDTARTAGGAQPQQRGDAGETATAGIPNIRGLDHVVIGVNDGTGALAAYERLGFTPERMPTPTPGGTAGRIDLENAYLEFVVPALDSVGRPASFTFEGGIAQGWEVADLEKAASALSSRGIDVTRVEEPPAAGGAVGEATRGKRAVPHVQPVSGTSVYFVDPARERPGEGTPAGGRTAPEHPNGARKVAYVTVATSRLEKPLEVLRSWGLAPADSQPDPRGSVTLEVPLPDASLYLTVPQGGGGIDDFLEERRALAPPIGDRFYEGSILGIGFAVDDLAATEGFLRERSITFHEMELPSGRALVVQGAPGWGLRLEFVEEEP